MKTLIIGASGYIGSRLIKKLNHSVTGIDLNWFSDDQTVLVEDYSRLDKHFIQGFDNIILLAGHSSVKMCDGPLQDVWFNNISNFLNLVKKIDKEQLLIYASSGSIYSATTNDNFVPINNYDLTKYVLDLQARILTDKGYKLVGLRMGTVNGYSSNFRSELMLNSMVSHAIKHSYISLTNLSVCRPILALSDLCSAIEAIIARPVSGIFDLCSFNSTVEELGHEVSEFFHVPIKVGRNLSNVYNFAFTNEHFAKTFDYVFSSSASEVIEEISLNFLSLNHTNRNTFKPYNVQPI